MLLLTSYGTGPVRFDTSTFHMEGSAQFLQGISAPNITAFSSSALSFSSTACVALGVLIGTNSTSISLVQNNATIGAAEIDLAYTRVEAFHSPKTRPHTMPQLCNSVSC